MFVASLAFFVLGAGSRGLWHSDEHRIAEVVREMSAPGGDWVVPHLGGEVYTHKPPPVAWIGAFAHGSLGIDIVLASRLSSILGAALSVLATFLIARRMYGATAGAAAAVVLATSAEFDWISRRAQYDPLLTGFTTLAMWFFVRSHFVGPPDEERTPWRDAVLGFLCVGLAILVKGPVALVFTALPIGVFAAISGGWRTLASRRLVAIVLVFVPAAIWLAFAIDRGGFEYAKDLVAGRLAAQTGGDDSKVEPFWYYLVQLPKGFLPWTLFLPAAWFAVTKWRRDEEGRACLLAIVWIVAPLVLMSLVPRKRDLYLLPLYPACAIVVGKLATVADEFLEHATFRVARIAVASIALVGGVAAVVAAAAVTLNVDGVLAARLDWWAPVTDAAGWKGPTLSALLGVCIAALGWQALRARSPRAAFDRIQGAMFLGFVGFAAVLLPAADVAESPRHFYEEAARIVGDAPVARYGVDDFAAHWTMQRNVIPYVESADAVKRFLAGAKGPAFVVVEQPTLDKEGMPMGTRVVLSEKLPLAKDLLLLGRE